MKKGYWLLLLTLVVIITVLAYFLGRKNGDITVQHIATNEVVVRQISELATLEVQGTASIKHSNILNDGSFTDALKKYLLRIPSIFQCLILLSTGSILHNSR